MSSRNGKSDLSVVEICAGAGGQSLGLEQAGFSHLAAVEVDRDACNTLRLNRPHWDVVEGDVTDVAVFDPAQYEGADLLAGGVPCPPFSIAGKQLGATDERDLFSFGVNLLEQVHSNALLLENVRGLAARRFAGYRARVLDLLHDWGYWAEWRLLQASDFGVPQLRPRFILVALKEEFAPYFEWPDAKPNPPTVGATLFEEMAADGWNGAERWRDAASSIAPTIVGGSKKHGGADLGPTRAKRAWLDLGVDAMGVADARPNRRTPVRHLPRLTNEMVALIQGWSSADGWQFTGRKTARYRQVGNAFPPPVARAVGASISRALHKQGEARTDLRRADLADAAVYRVLSSAEGQFMSVGTLVEETGQREERVTSALAHLDVDFVVERRTVRGEKRYRLLDFRGLASTDLQPAAK